MQIKLIAMDLDGTLMLPDHQRVGETTRRTWLPAANRVCAWRWPPVAPWR